MYAVSCFVRCYGRAGVLLAMGIFMVRLVFTNSSSVFFRHLCQIFMSIMLCKLIG